jgi:hypothetical protein
MFMVERAAEIANEGAALFRAGRHADASVRFSAALYTLDAAAPPDVDAATTAFAARVLGLQRARCLNNRGACHLRLGAPLAALDDAWAAIDAVCEPGARARGHWRVPGGPGSEAWGVLLSAVQRRVTAYEAAGTPTAPLPELTYVSRADITAFPGDRLVQAVQALLRAPDGAPPPAALEACPGLVAARVARLELSGDAGGLPHARRHGASAALDGWLYVWGGVDEGRCAVTDFWRAPLSAIQRRGGDADVAAWQQLTRPEKVGGPPHADGALLCAAPAAGELLALADGVLWAASVAAPAPALTWRCVGAAWPERGAGADVLRGAGSALATAGAYAYVYTPRAGLVRLCLRTGARQVLHAWSAGGAAADAAAPTEPRCTSPLLWAQGGRALYLWGGNAPTDTFNAADFQCFALSSPPPLNALWRFDLSTDDADSAAAAAPLGWRVVAFGGGGAPPPPRAEATLVPLDGQPGFEDGSAVVLGGYSEMMPQWATDGMTGMETFRYLNDVNLFTPSSGWRRLATWGGAPLLDAAGRAAGYAPGEGGGAAGAVVITGGYNGNSGLLSCADVCAVELRAGGGGGDAAAAAAEAAAARRATRERVLATLRATSTPERADNQMPPLPFDMPTPPRVEARRAEDANWGALLGAALAAPRGPAQLHAVMTWQETNLGSDVMTPFYQLTISGDVTCFYFERPNAADAMRLLLFAIVLPAGCTAPPRRPTSLLFAARVGHAFMQDMQPLLALLDIAPVMERWVDAARSAMMHDTDVWGFNAIRRCAHCRRSGLQLRLPARPTPDEEMHAAMGGAAAQPRGALRACQRCTAARYCGAECQKADWGAHRDACAFIAQCKANERG